MNGISRGTSPRTESWVTSFRALLFQWAPHIASRANKAYWMRLSIAAPENVTAVHTWGAEDCPKRYIFTRN